MESSRWQRFLVLVVGLVVLAVCLLSSPRPRTGEDAVTPAVGHLLDLLHLEYVAPTFRGVEIKSAVFRFGALVMAMGALLCGGVRLAHGTGAAFRWTDSGASDPASRWFRRAIILAVVLWAWAAVSSLWSPAENWAWPEALKRFFPLLWVVVLATSLSPSSVRWVAVALAVVAAITAAVGLIYFYGYQLQVAAPHQLRLGYPLGNALVLSSCLVPGLCVAVARGVAGRNRPIRLIGIGLVTALIGWAMWLTGSRGPVLGLLVGAVAALAFVLSKSRRRVLAAAVLGCLLAGAIALAAVPAERWARVTTVRMRLLTWEAVARMIAAPDHRRWLAGTGLGGVACLSTMYLGTAMADNPAAFPQNFVAHAHNQPLEVATELGVVGLGLWCLFWIAVAAAVWHALRRSVAGTPRPVVLGLLAGVTAVLTEEFTGVGLYLPGLPAVFYTALGALLAACGPVVTGPRITPPPGRSRRAAGIIAMIAAGTVVVWVASPAWGDWRSARRQYQAVRLGHQGKLEKEAALAGAGSWKQLDLSDRLGATWYTARVFDRLAERRLESAPQQAETAVRAGLSRTRLLNRRAPGFSEAFWLEGRLHLTLAEALAAQRKTESAARSYQNAADAFARQLLLNPYHAGSIEMLLLNRRLWPASDRRAALLLCGWMRNGPLSDNWHAALRALVRERPGFAAAVAALAAEATRLPPDRPSDWPDPLIPERFALAAQLALLDGDAETARHYYQDFGMPFVSQIADQFPGLREAWDREIRRISGK